LSFRPLSAQGFVLETALSLSLAGWLVVSNAPVQIGGEYLQSVRISGTNEFYRLQPSQ
jgi:hypothetical protein